MNKNLIIISALFLLPALYIIAYVEAYRVKAFIDINTGSRKGYKEISYLHYKFAEWGIESELEKRLKNINGIKIENEWVSYEGTGISIFGIICTREHGSPGPIVSISKDIFNEYIKANSDTEIIKIHEIFKGKNSTEIMNEIQKMYGQTEIIQSANK